MRFFLTDEPAGPPGTVWRATAGYIEVITTYPRSGGTSFLYVSAGPLPNSACVSACLGTDVLKWVVPLLEDEKRGKDWRRLIGRAFPTIALMWDAVERGDLAHTQLVHDYDPDDLTGKWFVRRIAGNVVTPDDLDEAAVLAFLKQDQIMAAYRAVLNDTVAVTTELQSRDISKLGMAYMMGKEVVYAQQQSAKLAEKWLPTITKIFGN